MGTQAQIQKTPPKQNKLNANNGTNSPNLNRQMCVQHPNISNNVLVEQSKETNDYRISLIINSNSIWKKSYTASNAISSVIEDFKKEKPFDYPQLNETQLYINQTLVDTKVALSSIVKKGIQKCELTLTYSIIGIEDFVCDSVNYLKHEIHLIGKPFPNPFSLLIFSRKDKDFKASEFTVDSMKTSEISLYSNLSAYCNGKNCIFLSGGEKGVLLNHFWEIDLTTQVIEKHPFGMTTSKKLHSMIYIPKNSVFIAGGSDKSTLCYNIKKKEMERWADMNTEHIEPALAIINSKNLYAFSNSKSRGIMFEKTNLRSTPKWDKIVPTVGNYLQFTQKFFGVCEENEESVIFLGGHMLEYDSNSQIDRYCFVYNHKTNKLGESNTKFEEHNLAEKTFLPFNSKFSFIIPNVSLKETKLLIYNKNKERIDVLKFDIPKECAEHNEMSNALSMNAAKSSIIPKKYLFRLPLLDEKDEANNIMAQSQINTQMNISSILNNKQEIKENKQNDIKEKVNQTHKREANKEDIEIKQREIVLLSNKDDEMSSQKDKEVINEVDNDKDKDRVEKDDNIGEAYTYQAKKKGSFELLSNNNGSSKSINKDNNDIILEEKRSVEANKQKQLEGSSKDNQDNKAKEIGDLKANLQKGEVVILKKKDSQEKKIQINITEKQEEQIEPNNPKESKPLENTTNKNFQLEQTEKKGENNQQSKEKEAKEIKKGNKELTDPKSLNESQAVKANSKNDKDNKDKRSKEKDNEDSKNPKENKLTSNNQKDQPPKADSNKKEVNGKEQPPKVDPVKDNSKKEREQKNKNENPQIKEEGKKDSLLLQKAETTVNSSSKPNTLQNDQQRANKFDLGEKINQEDAKQKEERRSSISQTKVELKQSGSMVKSSLIKGFGDKKRDIQLSGLPQVTKHRSPIQKSKVEISGTLNKDSLQNLKVSHSKQ